MTRNPNLADGCSQKEYLRSSYARVHPNDNPASTAADGIPDSHTRVNIESGLSSIRFGSPASVLIGLPRVLDAKSVSELRRRADVEWNKESEITVIREYRTISVPDSTTAVDIVFAPVAGANGNFVAYLVPTHVSVENLDSVPAQGPPVIESCVQPVGVSRFLQYLDQAVLAEFIEL